MKTVNLGAQGNREFVLTSGLNLFEKGLEVSPLYRPTVRKPMHNVFYTDYCSADESRRKHADYEHDPIMEIDFIWEPGKSLINCIDDQIKFDWAISSHVMEHVPNPIGWLLQILEVLNIGGVFSIALPDKRYCYDKFRRETDAADLIDTWIRNQSVPSPYQLFDFLSKSVDGSGPVGMRAFDVATDFEDAKRSYTDIEALNFVINSWKTGAYFDAHCSAFTPESFVHVFHQINNIGILNIDISKPILGHEEFFIQIKKIGEPRLEHPGVAHPNYNGNCLTKNTYASDLEHARKAFAEAVFIQNELKLKINKISKLQNSMPSWLFNYLNNKFFK